MPQELPADPRLPHVVTRLAVELAARLTGLLPAETPAEPAPDEDDVARLVEAALERGAAAPSGRELRQRLDRLGALGRGLLRRDVRRALEDLPLPLREALARTEPGELVRAVSLELARQAAVAGGAARGVVEAPPGGAAPGGAAPGGEAGGAAPADAEWRPPGLEACRDEAERLLRPLLRLPAAPAAEYAVETFRPREGDLARAFAADAVEDARAYFAALWRESPAALPRPGQTELRVLVVTAEMLAVGTGEARHFPPGYARIAAHLAPGSVWAMWRTTEPGHPAGMRFDGLVRVGERRWAWFPKPYRAFRE